MRCFEFRRPRDSQKGHFLVKHSLAYYSTYSNIHPPVHNTTPYNTPPHTTTVLQRHSVTLVTHNTISLSRSRHTSFLGQRDAQTNRLVRTCHRTGSWPRPKHSGPCCVAVALRCFAGCLLLACLLACGVGVHGFVFLCLCVSVCVLLGCVCMWCWWRVHGVHVCVCGGCDSGCVDGLMRPSA